MNHTWYDIDRNESVCFTCGCIRIRDFFMYYKSKVWFYAYLRNGMHFQKSPDCVDWDEPNRIDDNCPGMGYFNK